MRWIILVLVGMSMGCAGNLLPLEAPDDVVVGELKGCVEIERDGCKLHTCGDVE